MSVIKLVKVGQPPLTFQWGERPSLRCQSHSGNSSKNSSILAKAQKKIIGSAFFMRQLNQIRLLQQMTNKKKTANMQFSAEKCQHQLNTQEKKFDSFAILQFLTFRKQQLQRYFTEIRLSKIFSISTNARTRNRRLKKT